jgi:hypothetical protein
VDLPPSILQLPEFPGASHQQTSTILPKSGAASTNLPPPHSPPYPAYISNVEPLYPLILKVALNLFVTIIHVS